MKHSVLIFTTTYFPLVGGAEVAVKEITDRLPEQAFDLVCAKIKKDLPRLENIGHVRVHRFGFGYAFDKYLFAAFGGCYGLWLTRRLKQPVIWAVMASYGGFAALVSRLFRRDARFLLTLQEGDPLEHYTKRAGMFSSLHKLIFKHADAVQAISRFLADWAKQMGFCGTPSVIPNGVDLEVFDVPQTAEERKRIRTEHGFAENDIVLVTASRLVTKNGVDLLIRSLVHLPISYKALILGVGEDADALHAIVTELGLETRVVFAGSRPHRELVSFYQASDIFVRASRSEGLEMLFLKRWQQVSQLLVRALVAFRIFFLMERRACFAKRRILYRSRKLSSISGMMPHYVQSLLSKGERLCVRNTIGILLLAFFMMC